MKKNILILFGGGGNEHEVSRISKGFLQKNLSDYHHLIVVEMTKEKKWFHENKEVVLTKNKLINIADHSEIKIDYCIPCIHGYPGETGHLQALLELHEIEYMGCKSEASILCFNKLSTKLWLEEAQIKTAPFMVLRDQSADSLKRAKAFLSEHTKIFVKASSEGSSVGVYPATSKDPLDEIIKKAFEFSGQVILEKGIEGRELEISVYELDGKWHASAPGEIICPQGFYDYHEKYAADSKTTTNTKAQNLSSELIDQMKIQALAAAKVMGLRHLSRIDFFVDKNNQILINEINTFPGMTPISLFPQMMIANGHDFQKFLLEKIPS